MKSSLLVLSATLSALIASLPSARANEFVDAVRRSDVATWSRMLRDAAHVQARDVDGNTALHHAALNHDVAATRALLDAGADVNAKNEANATPLIYGAGSVEIVRLLLERRADPTVISKQSSTAVSAAAMHARSYEVLKMLADAGAPLGTTRGNEAATPLDRAVLGGDARTIDFLLRQNPTKPALNGALLVAANEGDVPLIAQLLELGADVNFAPAGAGHALNAALLAERLEAAQLLLNKGADLNLRSVSGHATPSIVFAAYNQAGDPAMAKALVAAGADVNVTNNQNATALTYALRNGAATPLVEYLRSVGATAPATRARRMPTRDVPATARERAELVRARMPQTLDLLRKSSMAFLDNKFVQRQHCTSCHGQDLPAVAFDLARARGFAIDDVSLGRQLAFQLDRWKTRAELARQMIRPTPGAPVSLAYGLFGLQRVGYPADEMTDALTRYLIRTQRTEGFWIDPTRRPPMEDGVLVATAWAALSVRDYAPAADPRAKADSLARAATWLEQQTPATHNETVMQLLGLHWSEVPAKRLAASRERVVHSQRADGGWAQLKTLESDAWATGLALYALHEVGMKTTDPVYQRGVAFLLRTQFEDGSWWVRSRSWPFQPHFDGQFPHGKDQWISQGATAWAAMALLFTLEPTRANAVRPSTENLIATFKASVSGAAATSERKLMAQAGRVVDFARDIRPLFERSCAGCHGAEKPRAGLTVLSATALLKGGASGEPSIIPGDADASPLVQYVTGKIEDLEMPPLDRREKYPALAPEEIALLRGWISAGAPGESVGQR